MYCIWRSYKNISYKLQCFELKSWDNTTTIYIILCALTVEVIYLVLTRIGIKIEEFEFSVLNRVNTKQTIFSKSEEPNYKIYRYKNICILIAKEIFVEWPVFFCGNCDTYIHALQRCIFIIFWIGIPLFHWSEHWIWLIPTCP